MNPPEFSKDCRCKSAPPNSVALDRWAIILAGGDGRRLRSLTRVISGDERPKQFCSLIGASTLLEQTRKRVELSVSPARTLVVVTKVHERFYNALPKEQLVIQPRNVGTAPAILYSLMAVAHQNPSAAVAIFPSDHYVSDDSAFMSYVETAFESVDMREDLVVLLGIKPETAETEYGWIEPISSHLADNPEALSWVRRFWEKPTKEIANDLMSRGCYWNSFVMVGKVSAFLKMIKRALPDLFERFRGIGPVLNTTNEEDFVRGLFRQLVNLNFSHEVLAARPGSLAVLPVTGVRWNDLGKPDRVLSTMSEVMPSMRFEQRTNSFISLKQESVYADARSG